MADSEFIQCPHEAVRATCVGVCNCDCAACAPTRAADHDTAPGQAALGEEEREVWEAAHAEICERGRVCSAHKPGFWPHLFHDLLARATAPRTEELAEAWDEGFMDAAGQDHPAYPRTRRIANPYSLDPRIVRDRGQGEGGGGS